MMFWVKTRVQRLCFWVLRKTEDSNYLKHAEAEFESFGWPGECEMQGWVCENLRDLLTVFSTQGHSGSSYGYVLSCFDKLARFKPLGPITGAASEWSDETSMGGSLQNKRLSSVFKEGVNGKPYYIDAIVFKEENGCCFTGSSVRLPSGGTISSRQFINLPFEPKTFYIDVISEEVAPDDWESTVKDESQLEEVFKYYRKE
jgi:hypothetical protein